MTLYIADEDVIQLDPFKVELELRGYNVKFLKDADEALKVLAILKSNEISLAVIDVMLSVNIDKDRSEFDRVETNDFLETGLVLIEKLSSLNPDVFPKKSALFSNATDADLVTSIENKASEYGIPYLDKSKFQSPLEFGDTVDNIVKKMTV